MAHLIQLNLTDDANTVMNFSFTHGPDAMAGGDIVEPEEFTMLQNKLRSLVSSTYDLQKLRMQVGQRIFSNVIATMGIKPGQKIYINEEDENDSEVDNQVEEDNLIATTVQEVDDATLKEKMTKEKEQGKILKKVSEEYDRITEALIKSMLSPELIKQLTEAKINIDEVLQFQSSRMDKALKEIIAEEFKNTKDILIRDQVTYYMVKSYMSLWSQEKKLIKTFSLILEQFPIYRYFLKHVPGCGDVMSACVLSKLNPYRANSAASFHAYVGIDCLPDGTARTRSKEQMIDREYVAADGTTKTRKSFTFCPWIKTKLLGVFAGSVIKTDRRGVYRKTYDNYKQRIANDPLRQGMVPRMLNGEPVIDKKTGQPVMRKEFPPARIEAMAKRKIVKDFLTDLYVHWCILEGIPVKTPYPEAKLNLKSKLYVVRMNQDTGVIDMINVLWDPENIPAFILYTRKMIDGEIPINKVPARRGRKKSTNV